jgi:Helix-turn-helix domain
LLIAGYKESMPAQHRLAKLHSLGGRYAEEAEQELKKALKGRTAAEAAAALGVHEKSLYRWIFQWGMSKKQMTRKKEMT